MYKIKNNKNYFLYTIYISFVLNDSYHSAYEKILN